MHEEHLILIDDFPCRTNLSSSSSLSSARARKKPNQFIRSIKLDVEDCDMGFGRFFKSHDVEGIKEIYMGN